MNLKQIGLLLPTSTIFPIAKAYENGFKKGLGSTCNDIEIRTELIGQGTIKQTEEAVLKLLNYYEVDAVTGILSARVTEYIAPKFKAVQKPLLVSEVGEYFPNPSLLNEFIFVNSGLLWQHAWALGNWGVKNIGKKGMFVAGVYDAGYSFSHMFYEGMMAADAEAFWSFSVPPNPPPGKLSDMSVIFHYMEQYQPDFVFAAFCGGETTKFLEEFINRGWHKRTQVLGLPFLLAPFSPLPDDIRIYTTLPDSAQQELRAEDTFFNLGLNAGRIAASAMQADNIHKGMLSAKENIMLGNTNYLIPNIEHEGSITIAENIITAHQEDIRKNIIGTTPTLSLRNEHLQSYIGELQAGWQNPYLCI